MLWGICHGTLRLPHGFAGRSLLGDQTLRANGTPPASNADSFKTRFAPNAVNGDIYITSVWTSSLYRFQIREDGTYWYAAGSDESRQLVLADLYSIANGLNGEGTHAINDAPPRPVNNTFLGGATFQYGQALSQQLQAVDPQGDSPITFSVIGSTPPGTSINSTGLLTGTPNTYGSFGFTVRVTDPYSAFSDTVEQVQVATVLPDFQTQLFSAAQAALAALGISASSTSVSSNLPLNAILPNTQSPPPGTVITAPGTTVSFQISNGALFTTNPNLFPESLPGITFESTRTVEFSTSYQTTIPGKVSTGTYMQYPLIRWDLTFELLNQNATSDELRQIEALFNLKQGSAGTFLYLDPIFNAVTAEPFGVNESGVTLCDGTKKDFQLVARYGNSGGPSVLEIIQQLQAAPAIFDNGSLVSTSNYTVGTTGIITFTTPPTAGHALTWSGSFYYLAQFDTDALTPQEFMNRLWELRELKLKSVIV